MNDQLLDQLRDQYLESEGKWFSLRWHYIESCILKAYMDGYKESGSETYYQFVKNFINRLYDQSGHIPEIDVRYYSIDQIRPATLLFDLYEKEKDPKYKSVLDMIYEQMKTYPRTKSGNFWHKENYPNQIWLDGLYMGQPFYVRYIKEFAEKKDYSDTIDQFMNVRKYIYNEEKHLYYHAYDESRDMFWCDQATGMSPNVWGRAVGWFVMALVDVLEQLEGEPCDTKPLKGLLQEALDGMLPYQHPDGMWYQVVDKGDSPGNYLESSGSLMLAYAMLKGSRLGYIAKEYSERGLFAFHGTVRQYLREEQGEVLLGGICRSAGLGTNPDTGKIRDGSFKYYTESEAIVSNNGHGVAPLLMAYAEVKLSRF